MDVFHGSEFFYKLLKIKFSQIMKYFIILVVLEKHFYTLRANITINGQQTILIKTKYLPLGIMLFCKLFYLELLF
jgi:hypothetical protein